MITYTFTLEDGTRHSFMVEVDRGEPPAIAPAAGVFWTELSYNQCPQCPLSVAQSPGCPPALDLEEVITRFRSLLSFQHATVEVRTPERTYVKECDVQTGLRSFLGLVMAASGCPILGRLKTMAYHHLPFANLEETLFRTVGNYLLKQYFVHKEGGRADLELRGLVVQGDELQAVSQAFKRRIDAASERDANMNAIGSLIFLAMAVSSSLEEQLQEIRPRVMSD